MTLTVIENDNRNIKNLPWYESPCYEENYLIGGFLDCIKANGFPRIKSGRNAVAITEFGSCGSGIADLLIAPKIPRLPNAPDEIVEIVATSPAAAKVFAALVQGVEFDPERVALNTGISLKRTKMLVRKFKEVLGSKRAVFPHVELWAFEAKVSDWGAGITQAFNYFDFSNRSTLVLPKSAGPLVEAHLPIFRLLGLGLWLFDEIELEIETILWPKKREPRYLGEYYRTLAYIFLNA
ncbi:MAG: hypothetical protein PVH29_06000 [Candidatus Zixiibacteriota bacterium]|jgi:hypothetical protein